MGELVTMPQWIITRDHVEDGQHTGFCSNGWSDTLDNLVEFQMYDDDGNLLYEGKATEECFDPKDKFGEPNAGATEIRYKNAQGEFVAL